MKKLLLLVSLFIVTVCNGQTAINVKDHGAIGDGKTDDSAAFQKAFDTACDLKQKQKTVRKVIIPQGVYSIGQTITLHPGHWNIVIEGTGGATGGSYGNNSRANTVLKWDGPADGYMFDTFGVLGLQMRDLVLNGQNKCAVLVEMNSVDKDNKDLKYRKKFGERGAALWFIERVAFENATVGFRCGSQSWICASDMTLIDVEFSNCGTGFQTLKDQNLNYNFIRPGIGKCDVGLHFAKGGNVTTNMLTGYSCGYAIKIDKGGLNAGTYNFIGTRVETRMYKGKRTALLYASGDVNVKFSSLLTTCMGLSGSKKSHSMSGHKNPDRQTPLFVLKNGAMISFDSSILSGPLAIMEGTSTGAKTWAQFTNCRFRFLADPRKQMTLGTNCGYEIRNCNITNDRFENGKYVIDNTEFITHITKLSE